MGSNCRFRNSGGRHARVSATVSDPKLEYFHFVAYRKKEVPDNNPSSIFPDHRRCFRHEALRPGGTAAGLGQPWYRVALSRIPSDGRHSLRGQECAGSLRICQ